MNRAMLMVVGAAALILAAIASAASAFVIADGSMDASRWVLATMAGAGAGLCLTLSANRIAAHQPPTWAIAIASLSLAALLPLSGTSCELRERADLALLCTAIAILLIGRAERRSWQAVTAGALVAVAGALDITSFILPLGAAFVAACGGWGLRSPVRSPDLFAGGANARAVRDRFVVPARVLLTAAVVGQTIATLLGQPAFCAVDDATLIKGVHQDLLVLLPVVMLALGGWKGLSARVHTDRRPDWLSGCAALGCLGLIAVLASFPLSVRMLILPLWWGLPGGLSELHDLCKVPTSDSIVPKCVGYLTCGLLVILSFEPGRRWGDAFLLTLYRLAGS